MKEKDVRCYYNQNTPRFLRHGRSTSRNANMHRSLRLPGHAGEDGTHAVHHLILDRFERFGLFDQDRRPLVADLGCGVGATIEWMLTHTGVDAVGITLSEVQARIARDKLGSDAAVHTGSFASSNDLASMTGDRLIDASYMIESLVHTDHPEVTLDAVCRQTVQGGLLVVCDDFPSELLMEIVRGGDDEIAETQQGNASVRRLAKEFREGWHINTFQTVRQLVEIAARCGWSFVEETDLSKFVVTSRPRDIGARVFALVARHLKLHGSFWQNVSGGGALQRLIRRGFVRYEILVLRRSD